ncbi:MAG: hypothetical protein EXS30_12015 [Pedosphaera sp.]|nr:hypothetical protein [Pedosphaera sp.]
MKADIRLLAALTQFNPNPIIELTADGQLSYCNDAARKMAASLGMGNPVEILPSATRSIVRTCLASGRQEHQCKTNGDQRQIVATFIPNEKDQMVHCYIRELEGRILTEPNGEAVAASESMTRLVQGIAHDFNNLLTLIQVNASTLLTEKNLDKEMMISAEQIYQAVDQAANLTSKLLAIGCRE